MEALRKRQFNIEAWEFENRRKLIQIFSFSLYLIYGAGKLFFSLFQLIFAGNEQVDHFLERENLKRLEISSRHYGINK